MDMHHEQYARELFLSQQARYPQCEINDCIKALYQAAFGCGHFVESEEKARAWLAAEMRQAQADADAPLFEVIGDRYARVHLSAFKRCGADETTLARLFVLTSREAVPEERKAFFQTGLDALIAMSEAGELSFDVQAVKARVAEYRAQGCPAQHHSQTFRDAYAPMYRVVRRDWAQLLELFARVDQLKKQKERVIVAIDGMSASGKSTLSQLLEAVYDTRALHMDDFFLQPHQRTPERFAQPGGNVDYERFLEEVLTPLRAGEAFDYRPYDCATQTIGAGERIVPGSLCIIEGAYSLHPAFGDAYDLRVLMTIGSEDQQKRILARNGEWMLSRFVNEWIPLEMRYLTETDAYGRSEMIFRAVPTGDTTDFVKEK